MFICMPCAEVIGVIAISRSWGSCEMCGHMGQVCYDIPTTRMPTPGRPTAQELVAARVIEELFSLARERRLLAVTDEAYELAAQDRSIDLVLASIPAAVYPIIVKDLVIAMDVMSRALGGTRARR